MFPAISLRIKPEFVIFSSKTPHNAKSNPTAAITEKTTIAGSSPYRATFQIADNRPLTFHPSAIVPARIIATASAPLRNIIEPETTFFLSYLLKLYSHRSFSSYGLFQEPISMMFPSGSAIKQVLCPQGSVVGSNKEAAP